MLQIQVNLDLIEVKYLLPLTGSRSMIPSIPASERNTCGSLLRIRLTVLLRSMPSLPVCVNQTSSFLNPITRFFYLIQARTAQKHTRQLCSRFASSMSTEAKVIWGTVNLNAEHCIYAHTAELIPFLVRIITPAQLKSVNLQLMKHDEKLLVNRVVECMVATGLQYVQVKSLDDGQYVYKLNHPIDELCVFSNFEQASGKKAGVRKSESMRVSVLPYPVRQMFAHQVEKERIRRAELLRASRQIRVFGVPSKPRVVKDLVVKNVVVKVFDSNPAAEGLFWEGC